MTPELARNRHAGLPHGSADWLLLQLADSAFPTGGFAHSSGLEAAWLSHEIQSTVQLLEFLHSSLHQAAHGAIPFVVEAFSGADILALDSLCDIFLSNHVANRASRAQGRALLVAAERAFEEREIKALRTSMTGAPAHLAPIFGRVTRLLGLEKEAGARLFLFMQMRSAISSAVRLGIVGPLEAQGIQRRLAAEAEQALQTGLALSIEQISQTAPLIDLFQGTQDRLYSRLFQS